MNTDELFEHLPNNLHWAANRIQEGEKAIKEVARLEEWLEWIAAHSVTETEIPGDGYQYLNMPPNEGADAALRGAKIDDCI